MKYSIKKLKFVASELVIVRTILSCQQVFGNLVKCRRTLDGPFTDHRFPDP